MNEEEREALASTVGLLIKTQECLARVEQRLQDTIECVTVFNKDILHRVQHLEYMNT